MNLNDKNIFLFDAVGALLSATLAGIVLPLFYEFFGMNKTVLYGLAALALIYSFYSFTCYRLTRPAQPWMLMAIILANSFYCLLISALLITSETLTTWGKAYLIAETAVIVGVVCIEVMVYRKTFVKRL